MSDWRLFIAVELPAAVRRILAAVQRDLSTSGADVKWSQTETMHLTLKFLGDTPEEAVGRLSTALDEAAAQSHSAIAALGALGAFPTVARPRVLWVGLDEPSGELVALQKRIDEATRYLVEPDERGFTPHLTLGRTRSGRGVRELATMLGGYRLQTSAEIPIREVVLFRSVLGRGGPTHTPLHRRRIG